MIQLSIIVPFYNVEEYIEECIRSFYNQDIPLSEYEVICVNDCSPDNSVEIVKKLQNEYSNLILIEHTENKKQGGARNTGLRYAKGEYIWFVDSDDCIMPNVLRDLLIIADRNNLEVLQFDYVRDFSYVKSQNIYFSSILNGEEYLFLEERSNWYDKIVGPWRQIYNRQFLISSNLKFIEEVQFEDTDYVLLGFISAKRVQYVSKNAYYYRINSESTTLVNMSPLKFAWTINQIIRCCGLIDNIKNLKGKKIMEEMVSNALSQNRSYLKKFTLMNKLKYLEILSKDIKKCKKYVTWRTWLSIRYGITFFI